MLGLCDCDSHLMKPPGLAASIWLRLPSYNTSLATGALRASLITDNEWKENPETEGERLLEGRKKRKWRMGKGKRSPSCSDFCCISEQQNFDCSTNRHCASPCAKCESSKEITHSSKMEKTNKQIRFTARRSEVKSTAYPSQNVSSQWRPRRLVKQAQGE